MSIFPYGQTEMQYLCRKDKKLGEVIVRIGKIEREVTPDVFAALVSSIVSQQISNKAAATVWSRLNTRLGGVTPQSVMAAPQEDIQACGMSVRKAGYIKGIAQAVHSGALPLAQFPLMADAEIIKSLSALHGVGVWTAEMLLLFSLLRPDILSWGDLALRRGMMDLYGHKTLNKTRFERYRKRYSPYGSVAALYLWELSHEK